MMLNRAPDRLRADMQRYYGLDLDQVGHAIRVRRAADLAANLPEQACVWSVIDERAAWDGDRWLLAQIADSLDFLAWAQTPAAQKHGAKWDHRIPRPGDHKPARDTAQGMTRDQLDRLLAMPRTSDRTVDHKPEGA